MGYRSDQSTSGRVYVQSLLQLTEKLQSSLGDYSPIGLMLLCCFQIVLGSKLFVADTGTLFTGFLEAPSRPGSKNQSSFSQTQLFSCPN